MTYFPFQDIAVALILLGGAYIVFVFAKWLRLHFDLWNRMTIMRMVALDRIATKRKINIDQAREYYQEAYKNRRKSSSDSDDNLEALIHKELFGPMEHKTKEK